MRDYSSGYVATNNLVVLGTTEDSLFQVADTLDGRERSLQSAPEFFRLNELAPEGVTYFVFADIAGIIDMVGDALPSDAMRTGGPSWSPLTTSSRLRPCQGRALYLPRF